MERHSETQNLPFNRREVKKYHDPKFLRTERKVIEEHLQQIIRGRLQGDLRQRISPQHNLGFQPQTSRSQQ